MRSQSHFSHKLSGRMQRLLDKSIDTLDLLLSEDELPFEKQVAIASRVMEFSTVAMVAADDINRSSGSEQAPATQADPRQSGQSVGAIAQGQAPTSVACDGTSSSLSFLAADYVQFDDFLTAEDYAELEAIAHSHNDRFQATSVERDEKSQQTDTRQSVVLYEANFSDFSQRIKQQVLAKLPAACKQLNHPKFEPSNIVAQLTAHNDGCFYKRHSDAASVQTATREMTYVYYFYREPQAFSGGELRIYDTELNNDRPTSRGTYKTVTPRNNSLIFFNSRCLHEVMAVSCPSQDFADSRFTINGWIRR
ncbi:MAG: 2OG-Fe(II) oxygenase [Elainellaceae cyanobacterium]